MSKKKNDQNFISELLGKLKASYSEPEKKTESKKTTSKSESDDLEFQKQLEAMLNKASIATMATEEPPVEESKPEPVADPPKAKKAAPKKKATKKTAPKAEKKEKEKPEPIQESVSEPVISIVEEPEESPIEILPEPEPEILMEAVLEEPEEIVAPIEQEPEPVAVIPPVDEPVRESIDEESTEATEEVEKNELVEETKTEEKIEETKEEIKEIEETVDTVEAEEVIPALPLDESKPEAPKARASAETIVIRPRGDRSQKQNPIVIRPRAQKAQTPAPKRVTQSISQEPIRIGKEASQQVKAPTPKKAPDAAEQATEQKEPKVVRVPQASTAPAASKPTVKTEQKASEPSPKKAVKKKEAPINTSLPPVTPLNEPEASDKGLETATPSPAKPRSEKVQEKLSFEEQIHQKTGLNEEDVALLFELGYDNELSNLVGAENLKKLKSAHLRKQRQTEKKNYPTSFGYRGKEYTGEEDKSAILATYIHDRKHLILRLVLTALGALCLLLVQTPTLRGAYWAQLDQSMPWVLPTVGMLLLLVTAAFSAKQLLEGAKALFRFAPSPYSVCGVLLIPALIYDVLALFTDKLTLPVNLLIALAILITVICDVLRLCCEMRVFRVLSEEGDKHILESATLRKKKMKYGDKVIKILNDDVGESFYRISQAKEVTGFFRRSNTMSGAARPFAILILSSVGLSLLLAFAVAIRANSFFPALSSFMISLLVGTPLSAVFGYFYPMFHANRLLTRHHCALVGEESVEEYNQPKTLIFEDHDMFHTEKCTEIVLQESGDFQTDMKLASALFRKIGNTLDPIGNTSAQAKGEPSVTLIHISENGTESSVNDRHLLAGDAAFFKKYGIRIPKESADRALRRTENVRVMYVAIDGVLKISYEIEYTEKFTFEKTVESLLESHTSVAIRSYDPNLNTAFVQEIRKEKAETIRVIKPGRYEDTSPHDLIDTGAVSLDTPEKTVCALHAAAKIGKTRKLTARLQLIATLLGCGLTLLLAFFGSIGAMGGPQILFYHLFWILVSLIATHVEITEAKLHLLK
ncbi:MAG: hypothetical protein IJX19_03105 [Clostridia bacterium]|nr:hypothetical protein [Clostridia bacterium]